jgi:hypothetical protein
MMTVGYGIKLKITRFDAGKTGQVAFDAPGLWTTMQATQADE